MAAMTLLPTELKSHIAGFCDPETRHLLAGVSKEWRAVVREATQRHINTELVNFAKPTDNEKTVQVLANRTRSMDLLFNELDYDIVVNFRKGLPKCFRNLVKLLPRLQHLARFSLRGVASFNTSSISGLGVYRTLQTLTKSNCATTLVDLSLDICSMSVESSRSPSEMYFPCEIAPLAHLPNLKRFYVRLPIICEHILSLNEECEDAHDNGLDEEDEDDAHHEPKPPIALESLIVNLTTPLHSSVTYRSGRQITGHDLPNSCRHVYLDLDEIPLDDQLSKPVMRAMKRIVARAPALRTARFIGISWYAERQIFEALDMCTGVRYEVAEGDWEGGRMLHGPADEESSGSLNGFLEDLDQGTEDGDDVVDYRGIEFDEYMEQFDDDMHSVHNGQDDAADNMDEDEDDMDGANDGAAGEPTEELDEDEEDAVANAQILATFPASSLPPYLSDIMDFGPSPSYRPMLARVERVVADAGRIDVDMEM